MEHGMMVRLLVSILITNITIFIFHFQLVLPLHPLLSRLPCELRPQTPLS